MQFSRKAYKSAKLAKYRGIEKTTYIQKEKQLKKTATGARTWDFHQPSKPTQYGQ